MDAVNPGDAAEPVDGADAVDAADAEARLPAWRGDPAPPHAFALRLDADLALRLRERHHAQSLFDRIEADREHLGQWFAWTRDLKLSEIERITAGGLEQFRSGNGWHADLCWRGELAGSMGLHSLQGPGGSTEVGFWLSSGYQGKGLVTRAMRALMRHMFEARELGRVALAADPRNERSLAVARRLGMQPEVVLRRANLGAGGEPRDLAFFGLLREDFVADDAGPLPLPRFALRVDDEIEVALFERADADPLAELVQRNQEHLHRWMPWAGATSPKAMLTFIEGRSLPAIANADGFEAGIYLCGQLAGCIGLHAVDRRTQRGAIGYWLSAEHQGQGVVARAAWAVMARCFDGLGFQRLEIRADVDNRRSRAVAERLGFRFEGVLPRELPAITGRGYRDVAVYGMLRSEWAGLDQGVR